MANDVELILEERWERLKAKLNVLSWQTTVDLFSALKLPNRPGTREAIIKRIVVIPIDGIKHSDTKIKKNAKKRPAVKGTLKRQIRLLVEAGRLEDVYQIAPQPAQAWYTTILSTMFASEICDLADEEKIEIANRDEPTAAAAPNETSSEHNLICVTVLDKIYSKHSLIKCLLKKQNVDFVDIKNCNTEMKWCVEQIQLLKGIQHKHCSEIEVSIANVLGESELLSKLYDEKATATKDLFNQRINSIEESSLHPGDDSVLEYVKAILSFVAEYEATFGPELLDDVARKINFMKQFVKDDDIEPSSNKRKNGEVDDPVENSEVTEVQRQSKKMKVK